MGACTSKEEGNKQKTPKKSTNQSGKTSLV